MVNLSLHRRLQQYEHGTEWSRSHASPGLALHLIGTARRFMERMRSMHKISQEIQHSGKLGIAV